MNKILSLINFKIWKLNSLLSYTWMGKKITHLKNIEVKYDLFIYDFYNNLLKNFYFIKCTDFFFIKRAYFFFLLQVILIIIVLNNQNPNPDNFN